ncbi:MAG TPA: arginine--tRNA ligase [Maribacter sp.]|uniref:arginine--tRNA ligase n=1 Tax=unclassified Maribacter TaxID=2615042 RepID=UPI000EE89DFD|nr:MULTISPECIES: arginine--tRNA ligase [unclassified Maribacter]HAF76602.1 arginine--tRNA ligase [Maribacter sp.]|tara:strand:+ start:287121 stop:288902 length:1782 start_codon:yes stop_codon:yes gene_type:complete
MNIQEVLSVKVKEAVKSIFDKDLPNVEFQPTRKDFEGDITIVVFPMLRVVKGNPVQIGEQIGAYLEEHIDEVAGFNVIKGFLNIVINDSFYLNFFNSISTIPNYGYVQESDDAVMVEYSSPNTNKPLHLGHIRNNLLGYSVAEILKASGKKVYKTQIINDRGIHICKSMVAWQKFGNGETPISTGLKGDKLVGNYYVAFDKAYKEQIADLVAKGIDKKVAEKEAPILLEAQEMLLKWEAGDPETVTLWKTMNGWVYKGFEVTYKNLGVDFDTLYYESDTYLLGKDVVAEGLKKGIFFKKEDGSVWIDLTEDGLDEKIVLRSDGTAVYMTQDIGTAIQRVKDHPDVNGMVYTVGNEQDYHFKVLFLILQKLGFSWSKKLHHLSYGMVDLPSGKMKSREGTVVDADDLMADMTQTAANISEELGKLEDYNEEEKQTLYQMIGLGALKYYILKVDPKKRILFDPEESVDFQGNTGPFIQYTYARIQSILRKAESMGINISEDAKVSELHSKEKELIKQLQLFPETIQLAADNFSPALIANFTYDLVKEFNSFYQQVSILGEVDEAKKVLRVQLSKKVAQVIQDAFKLLGVEVPERM